MRLSIVALLLAFGSSALAQAARPMNCQDTYDPRKEIQYVAKAVSNALAGSPFSGKDEDWYYSGNVLSLALVPDQRGDSSQWNVLFEQMKTSTRVGACEGCMPIVEVTCYAARFQFSTGTGGCFKPSAERVTDLAQVACPGS